MDGKESLLKFEEIQQSETSYALIRMNIKNFRYYNAKYGRETGNQILKDVYDLIKSTLTQDDYIVREYAEGLSIKLCKIFKLSKEANRLIAMLPFFA